jgi:hypothetical protein
MPFEFTAVEAVLGIPFEPKPIVRGWNRLEGRPREENFERALRAEARDALWYLARQWQFLELRADDAGSPIDARVALRQTKLATYTARGAPAQDFPTDLPLETVVEREPAPMDRVALIQIYRAFDKALPQALSSAARAQVFAAMRAQYPLDVLQIEGVDDAESKQLAVLTDEHLFDAATFYGEARDGGGAFSARVDAEFGLPAPLAAVVKQAGQDTAQWYAALYSAPPGPAPAANAWEPRQLEYQFRCATEPGPGQTVLDGTGYASGRLDWFAVDVAAASQEPEEPRDAPLEPIDKTLSMLPAAVTFSGMPSHRFWELEDRKVEFGALTVHTTDIGKLLLTEFMLAYGNDWCVVPFVVDVGSLCDTLGIVVKDVFGDVSLIRAADRGFDEDWRRWAMFGLETDTPDDRALPRIFVPPTTPKILESAPLERVVFLRDEMANMCWAVERTVPSKAGSGIDGEQYALTIAPAPPADPAPAPGATARFRLGTTAPPNWRPFIPVHIPGSIRSVRLQRARLPIGLPDPLGKIIGEPQPTYFINEEEVPRAGRIVVRTFQRTRWIDGRVVLWLGRRTLTGRGEGSSGLAFDVLEEIPSRE